ncbi:MAG: Pirin-related protein, partial [Lacrimispora sp.]|nr:Pirin-related protein [Lacrimispora sp.]
MKIFGLFKSCKVKRGSRISKDSTTIGVLSGTYEGATGVKPRHIPVSIYDIELKKGGGISLPVKEDETV